MPSAIVIIASILSGGLAGACISVIYNRRTHLRALRTKFYPVLNNIVSAYVIRMEEPKGRYWTTIVGKKPAPEDEDFINHRSTFTSDLVQYNELKEVRALRKKILDNAFSGDHKQGETMRLDLTPEATALHNCLTALHKKLKL